MATCVPITAAPACASSNVIRLPTAAPRQVKQRWNKATRALRAALPPFPGEHIWPSEREAMKTAAVLIEMRSTLTPEMELLSAICATLDDAARDTVAAILAPGAAVGRRSAVQALAVLRSTRLTVGEQLDLSNAIRRLEAR